MNDDQEREETEGLKVREVTNVHKNALKILQNFITRIKECCTRNNIFRNQMLQQNF